MQHNYYFLFQLSKILDTKLKGLPLVSCFSQNKDELLLGFANQEECFYVKALLSSVLCCLSFPDGYNRSRKNSVDLFQSAMGYEVSAVRQFENERSFAIYLKPPHTPIHTGTQDAETSKLPQTNKIILFKMYGQRANILLLETENQDENQAENQDENQAEMYVVSEIFKSELEKDWELSIENLDKKIVQNESTFKQMGLQKTFPTFDKETLQFLTTNSKKSIENIDYQDIEKILPLLKQPTYYVFAHKQSLHFSLFKPEFASFEQQLQANSADKILLATQNPMLALNEFHRAFTHTYYFETEKKEVVKKIETKLKQTENYVQKTEQKLLEFIDSVSYNQMADIIMANLHDLPKSVSREAKFVELFDFYNNKPLKVKLKENMSPQKTAEVYYKKAKNQQKEIENLEKNLAQKQDLLTVLKKHLENLQAIEDFKVLRNYLKDNKLEEKEEQEKEVLQLFRRFQVEGFDILIGRNAANNDLLTQRHAYKEDLWLHARDVAGSHVVIKYQAGKKFPISVIERAAQLAAYFSKRKNESLCPVIYTPKKFVRKLKGAAQGAVKIEREQVLMVQPSL
jgi:predicted ribosome quality control (RQC) complex YloA/Tae2 family protein